MFITLLMLLQRANIPARASVESHPRETMSIGKPFAATAREVDGVLLQQWASGQVVAFTCVDGKLPMGRLIVTVSKHECAVINGVIYDTSDPLRGGTRCVYGFWSSKPAAVS